MSQIRFYIKPFNEMGEYVDDFIEVTNDIDIQSLGKISRQIDGNSFDVGVFKYNELKITLMNASGKYSAANTIGSIFKFKRSDSLVKITWDPNLRYASGGAMVCGEDNLIEQVLTIFEGLLNDETFVTEIDEQKAAFSCLGFESLFDRVSFPFDLATNGDTTQELIELALNQSQFTNLLDYDVMNINVDLDIAVDDIESDLQNKTVKEAIDFLLNISNSVLYIEDRVIYVRNREPNDPIPAFYFFGQGSDFGAENIADITEVREGLNRVFNYWTWNDQANIAIDTSSIDAYGVKKKELNYSSITDNSNRDLILETLRDAWSFPKQEFQLLTPMSKRLLGLKFFDRVSVDYPTIFYPYDDEAIALYDISIYDEDIYPNTQFSLVIDPEDGFKIMGITFNIKDQTIEYSLRKV